MLQLAIEDIENYVFVGTKLIYQLATFCWIEVDQI